jgi:hypothetical protein
MIGLWVNYNYVGVRYFCLLNLILFIKELYSLIFLLSRKSENFGEKNTFFFLYKLYKKFNTTIKEA